MRIPQSAKAQETETTDPREAFLVRQASDALGDGGRAGGSERKVTASKAWLMREREVSGNRSGGRSTTGVAEGIGVDARKWVEGLLALNR